MRLGWRGLLGIAVSAGFLWWTLRDVSVAQLWAILRTANVPLLAASTVAATLIFPLRALRWRVILEPVAPGTPLGVLWRATAIGMMVNNLVPARAGEVARAYALTREDDRVRFAPAFASLAVDRLLDAVVVVVLLGGAMLASRFPPGTTISGQPVQRVAWLAAAAATVVLAALTAMALRPPLVLRAWDAVVGRVAPAFAARGRGLLEGFLAGLGVLRSPGRFARAFGWALALWLMNGLAFWLGFVAVGIEAPVAAALFLQGVIAIGVALPSSPGFFGVFEAAALAGLTLYGVAPDRAVSWALSFHLLSFLPITAIGIYHFGRLGLRFDDLGRGAAPTPTR